MVQIPVAFYCFQGIRVRKNCSLALTLENEILLLGE